MSCGLALVAVLMISDPGVSPMSMAGAVDAAAAPAAIASEPLFAEIVRTSGRLKAIVDGWTASGAANAPGFFAGQAFGEFKAQAGALSEADMRAHHVLAERGVDGDLKCILRGISEDLPRRIEGVETASSPDARALALLELSHLLDDNAAVITSPPQPGS